MTRRTAPQHKTDDGAFPVRVIFAVPETGLGMKLDAIHLWLRHEVGLGDYAVHSGGRPTVGVDSMAIYFRHPKHAVALMAEFPSLKLHDGTTSESYYSPMLRYRRQ